MFVMIRGVMLYKVKFAYKNQKYASKTIEYIDRYEIIWNFIFMKVFKKYFE